MKIDGTIFAFNINYMDKKEDIADIERSVGPSTGTSMTVFCKLFSDTISRHLCDLRRRELNTQGIFSCEGCSSMSNNEAVSSSI
jgi:hypothetical protein